MSKKGKLLFFAFCFLLCALANTIFFDMQVLNAATAEDQSNQYARIKFSNCNLWRNPTQSTEYENVFFSLPQTYFVKLLSHENETFFRASYMGITGYVRKSDVECVKGVPANPFANKCSFRVFAQNGLNLRENPSDSDGVFNRITVVPYLETNLQYFGEIEGEESVPYRGNKWYFCKYISTTEEHMGYLYAGYCDRLSEISLNSEEMEVIPEPIFETEKNEVERTSSISKIDGLSTTSQTLIIIGVCLPALLIIYLLFKPTRILEKATERKKSKTRRRKYKGDYYELEE